MHYDPKCKQMKHKCFKVCTSENCNIVNPFICDSCGNHHKQDCQVIQYKDVVRKLHSLQGINRLDLNKYEDYVEHTFKTLIKSLQSEFVKFRDQYEQINASPRIAQFYQVLKSHKENKLTGRTINNLLHETFPLRNKYKLKTQAMMWGLSSEIIELQKKVNQKLPYYYSIYDQDEEEEKSINQVDLDLPEEDSMKEIQQKFRYYRNQIKGGLLENKINVIQNLFQREIYNIQLIFRASDHQFSAKTFHQLCDGKKNTLTIAKTQYGNLVGGYTTVSWRSPARWQYQEDPSNKTFIFSLGKHLQGLRFTPFKKKFTVGMHCEYGPCFGDDLVIYDKSSTSKNCWSNFPDCFTCKEKNIDHDEHTIKLWVGVNDHYKKFNIMEWQVYKISFDSKEQVERSFMQAYRKI